MATKFKVWIEIERIENVGTENEEYIDEEIPFGIAYVNTLNEAINLRDNINETFGEINPTQKSDNIAEIKRILKEWGETTATERELDSSPVLNSIGNGLINVSELVEEFKPNGVETITYQDENDLGYTFYEYEELPANIIGEILMIINEYEADMLKTEKRCAD